MFKKLTIACMKKRQTMSVMRRSSAWRSALSTTKLRCMAARDHTHGRIYRMTYEGMPLLKPATIDGAPVEALLQLLKEPENDVRTRAKIELGKHESPKVMSALKKWTASLDKKDPAYEHHLTEALWVHQWHNVVNDSLLR